MYSRLGKAQNIARGEIVAVNLKQFRQVDAGRGRQRIGYTPNNSGQCRKLAG